MSDRIDTGRLSLPDALRALPLVAPERSAWPALAAQLATSAAAPRSARRRRFALPVALAAAVVLAAILAQRMRNETRPDVTAEPSVASVASVAGAAHPATATPATVSRNGADDAPGPTANEFAQLAALRSRSQALERWLHETGAVAAPLNGQDLAAAIEIEDLIGLVDVQLGANGGDLATALWHRRVALLEDLSALRYSSDGLAERATANNGATAQPAIWTN